MASIDTNVLVRYLVRDDERQFQRVHDFISRQVSEKEPLHIPVTVALEVEWVLRSRYKFDKDTVISAYLNLLRTREVTFENETAVEVALHHYQTFKADFADCLHVALAGLRGHPPLYTFDEKAGKIPGASLL